LAGRGVSFSQGDRKRVPYKWKQMTYSSSTMMMHAIDDV